MVKCEPKLTILVEVKPLLPYFCVLFINDTSKQPNKLK